MAITFTSQQTRVLQARNHNILVSAAAGSGKTAVLVERIVRMISEGDSPLDIDRLLVVTFTKAAAAQMRERRIIPRSAPGRKRRPFLWRNPRFLTDMPCGLRSGRKGSVTWKLSRMSWGVPIRSKWETDGRERSSENH
jgi:superfamily I DNA and RNA helicase